MKIMIYGQVLFVVVRFIFWLSATKRSEKARLESIPKSEEEAGIDPVEGA